MLLFIRLCRVNSLKALDFRAEPVCAGEECEVLLLRLLVLPRGLLTLEVLNALADVAVVALARELEDLVNADLEILALIDLTNVDANFKYLWVAVLMVVNVLALRMIQALLIEEFLKKRLRDVLETHRITRNHQLVLLL